MWDAPPPSASPTVSKLQDARTQAPRLKLDTYLAEQGAIAGRVIKLRFIPRPWDGIFDRRLIATFVYCQGLEACGEG